MFGPGAGIQHEGNIGRLRDAIAQYAAAFDPAVLSPAQAAVVVRVVASMEASLAAIRALAAARAAEGDEWKKDGHRSAAEALARQTGSTVGHARDTLQLGKRLANQPQVANAAKAGDLSATQAQLISDAAADNPAATGRLLDEARKGSVATLRDACAQSKASAAPDPEKRRRRIHSSRGFRQWTDTNGVWRCAGQGLPEDGAQLMSVLQARTESEFDRARLEGRRERPDAYAFDALINWAKEEAATDPESAAPAGAAVTDVVTGAKADAGAEKQRTGKRRRRRRSGAPVKLLLRVDYDTWLRGFPLEGETCELVGYGPVSVAAAKRLVDQGDPFVAAILTRAKQVVGVAHLGRKPTAHQRSALEWLNPTCRADGCPIPWDHLEIDHRIDWAKTHVTALDQLDGACRHHHRLKTREDWAFVEGGHDRRAFVSPDDPRHPRHARSNRATPAA